MFLLCLLLLSFSTQAATHHPQSFLDEVRGSPGEGRQIYAHFCVNCHATHPLIPLGAPRRGKSADWGLRLQGGLDKLLQHTHAGLNAMPPRGGCFECSDEQLMLATIYMLPKETKKSYKIMKKPINKPKR